MNNSSDPKGGKNKTTVMFAILGILIVALGGAVFYLVSENMKPEAPPVYVEPTVIKGTVLTEENKDEVLEAMRTPPEDPFYNASMSTTWVFKNGDSVSETAIVRNKETNKRTVYFQVIMSDTNQLLYTSPYLEVGAELDEIKLDVDLDEGEYEAAVKYILVDDDYNELTNVSLNVTLIVES